MIEIIEPRYHDRCILVARKDGKMEQKQFNDAELGKIGYSLRLAVWRPDGSCYEESSVSISAQEYEELFGRFVLRQESKTDDFVHQALKAQAERIRQLEQQVRNLGGNQNGK